MKTSIDGHGSGLHDEIEQRFEFGKSIALEAGKVALAFFKEGNCGTSWKKAPRDVVTDADIAVETLIRKKIEKRFDQDNFLGEESVDEFVYDETRGTWIVDPIDGTLPFSCRIPSWCVSIAFYRRGNVQFGIVYDPVAEELFSARAGQGAHLNGLRISCSDRSDLKGALVSIGYSSAQPVDMTLQAIAGVIAADGMFHRSGSGALSLAYVAAGRLAGYFEPHMQSWDFAAAALLVSEAGGECSAGRVTAKTAVQGALVLAAPVQLYRVLESVVLKGSTHS